MDYDALLSQVIELLQREKRVPYRALKRRFDIDDDYIEDLKSTLSRQNNLPLTKMTASLSGLGK